MAGSAAAVMVLGGLLFAGIEIGRKTVSTTDQASSTPRALRLVPKPLNHCAGRWPSAIGRHLPHRDPTLQANLRLHPEPAVPGHNYLVGNPDLVPTSGMPGSRNHARRGQPRPSGPQHQADRLRIPRRSVAVAAGKVQFACVHVNGTESTESTTQVLSLRPQPLGELVGEMVVTVHTDECGQGEGRSDSGGGDPQCRCAACGGCA